MFTLGLGLTSGDFINLLKKPKSFFVGITNQMVMLPLTAFIIISLAGITKEIAVGMMILASCPGGVTSNMITKGVLGDQSSSIFTGTIHIAEGAEKTESHQENRNILLSKEATAQSVPNLEILCDDVICSHGSSVGPIEENIYHYVMSRGIKKVDADKLLIKGFFNEVINNSKWAIVHDKVSEIIDRKYMNLIGRKNG